MVSEKEEKLSDFDNVYSSRIQASILRAPGRRLCPQGAPVPPPFPGGGSARGRVRRLRPRKGGASHSLPGLGSWGPLRWGASRACPQRPLLLPGARPRLTAHVPSALGVWPSCSCWCSASASWWPASCTCTSPGSRCVRACPVAAHTWTGVLVASARPLAGQAWPRRRLAWRPACCRWEVSPQQPELTARAVCRARGQALPGVGGGRSTATGRPRTRCEVLPAPESVGTAPLWLPGGTVSGPPPPTSFPSAPSPAAPPVVPSCRPRASRQSWWKLATSRKVKSSFI